MHKSSLATRGLQRSPPWRSSAPRYNHGLLLVILEAVVDEDEEIGVPCPWVLWQQPSQTSRYCFDRLRLCGRGGYLLPVYNYLREVHLIVRTTPSGNSQPIRCHVFLTVNRGVVCRQNPFSWRLTPRQRLLLSLSAFCVCLIRTQMYGNICDHLLFQLLSCRLLWRCLVV